MQQIGYSFDEAIRLHVTGFRMFYLMNNGAKSVQIISKNYSKISGAYPHLKTKEKMYINTFPKMCGFLSSRHLVLEKKEKKKKVI